MPPFEFRSPGAAAARGITDFFTRRDEMRRQQLLDELLRQRQEQQLQMQAEQLRQQQLENTRAQTAQDFTLAQARLGSYAPDDVMAEADVELGRRFFPGGQRTETTLPARTLDAPSTDVTGGAPPVPGIMLPPTPTGRTLKQGTPAQRQTQQAEAEKARRVATLMADPSARPSARRFASATGDVPTAHEFYADPAAEKSPANIDAAILAADQSGDQAELARLLGLKQRMEAAGRAPKETSGAEVQRQRLVEAVVANPSLWDDLTPTSKGDIAADLATKGFSGFGRRLSDSTIQKISDSKSAVAGLRDLRKTLEENEQYIGPIAGLQALNPYSDARKAQAKIDLVKQRAGKTLEGGVLRKEDEDKYKKILATLQDEPTTAIFKVDNLIATLERDMETFIEEQRAAGRRVAPPAGGGGGRKYYDANGNPVSR